MKKESQAHETLSILLQDTGVPHEMVMDGGLAQFKGEFRRKLQEVDCKVRRTEPHTPWSNAAELAIREGKKHAGRIMVRQRVPRKLWDHCLELVGYIRSCTALDTFELDGQVPETIVSGQTADISPFVEHAFYDWVYFLDTSIKFPNDKMVLGRWLGPAHNIGPAMTAKILKSNGEVLYRSTYRGLTTTELQSDNEKQKRELFDKLIYERLGGNVEADADLDAIDAEAVTPTLELYEEDVEGTTPHAPDADDEVTPEFQDNYIGAEVQLSRLGEYKTGKVKRRAKDEDGEVYGQAHSNPMLDTRGYEVEFPDGEVHEYTANVIA